MYTYWIPVLTVLIYKYVYIDIPRSVNISFKNVQIPKPAMTRHLLYQVIFSEQKEQPVIAGSTVYS